MRGWRAGGAIGRMGTGSLDTGLLNGLFDLDGPGM